MNKRTFIVLCFAFMAGATNLHAQTDKQSAADEATKRRLEYKMSHAKRVVELPTEVGVQDDRYNHREKEIMERLNTDAIPADFPVYKTEYTNEQYTLIMNKWYGANPALVKEKTNTNNQK